MNYPYSAYSWDILSDDIALKHLDKSSFLHHSIVIPKEIAFFFHLPETGLSEPMPILLKLGDTAYDAHFHMDAMSSRYRMFWKTDFSDQLIERFPYCYRQYALNKELSGESPIMRIKRTQRDYYEIDLIESASLPQEIDSKAEDWTDQELEAAVHAYFIMLNKERSGKAYNKSEINRQLRSLELSNRNKGSIEFRMQNISSVLQELCHPIIQAYLPRVTIGSDVSERIKEIIFRNKFLNEKNYTPTSDANSLDERVRSLLKKGLVGIPKGQTSPEKQESARTAYERDPLVKAWVLQNANGNCELCRNSGPFIDRSGRRFLEVHHVISLSDHGSDTIENAVALCPNCHRKCHLSPEADTLQRELRYTIDRIA